MHFVLSTHNSQGISYHKYLHSVLIRTFAFASYQPANQAPADSESGFHAIHTFLMRHVPGWYHILARTLSPKRGGHFLLELAHLGAVFELLLFSLIWCDSTQIHFLKARKKRIIPFLRWPWSAKQHYKVWNTFTKLETNLHFGKHFYLS